MLIKKKYYEPKVN